MLKRFADVVVDPACVRAVSKVRSQVNLWRYPADDPDWKERVEKQAKKSCESGEQDILFPVKPSEYGSLYGVETVFPGSKSFIVVHYDSIAWQSFEISDAAADALLDYFESNDPDHPAVLGLGASVGSADSSQEKVEFKSQWGDLSSIWRDHDDHGIRLHDMLLDMANGKRFDRDSVSEDIAIAYRLLNSARYGLRQSEMIFAAALDAYFGDCVFGAAGLFFPPASRPWENQEQLQKDAADLDSRVRKAMDLKNEPARKSDSSSDSE